MEKPNQATVDWLKSIAGELATVTLGRLDELLPWYRVMPAARRSSVGLVAQTGISSFLAWYQNPESQPWVAADVFSTAPRELLRSISLQETLQLIRVVVQVVEDRVVQDDPTLREAVLLYSREIAFSAADVYAKAAEARGLWDERLEALVVDSIVSGENQEELSSRIAALGWRARGAVSVLIGNYSESLEMDAVRRIARKQNADVLIGVHANRLVLVLGQLKDTASDATASELEAMKLAVALSDCFASGSLVLGPVAVDVREAAFSAKAALSAHTVVKAWPRAPRPVHADDVLAERALAGDRQAKATLIERIYRPLTEGSAELLETLRCYLETGRSLEATARELFVHPNTVRYRLKRVAELIGWDATGAREAFILQIGIVLGSMTEKENKTARQEKI